MVNKQALVALAACLTSLPLIFADGSPSVRPPMGFCKEGTCSDDDDGCPTQITSSGDGFPSCKVYDTETVLSVGDFEAAEGGGTKVFLDIFDPGQGCAVIVKSPASTDEEACGFTVGSFRNPVCAAIALKDTFMIQHCCGSGDCEAAGAGAKMVRGMDYKRGLSTRSIEIKDKDGNIIEPSQVGEPPQKKALAPSDPPTIFRRDDLHHKDCKEYVPDGEVYTRPADAPQIVATGVDGGTTGSEVTISHSREVSQSISFTAGVNIEIISAETTMTFEESITDTKEKKWTIPAGQSGKVGFTPNLKCSKGSLFHISNPILFSLEANDVSSTGAMKCKDGTSTGEACTGYKEADEIAGTYAVIATS
ncbi:MAG: hypothetical protein LQ343_005803 [Gyalolechia ehrenbergii]|nr:MAG: hypothetical protein LQ343_005803 [Gyalolechia ehrenbergii]